MLACDLSLLSSKVQTGFSVHPRGRAGFAAQGRRSLKPKALQAKPKVSHARASALSTAAWYSRCFKSLWARSRIRAWYSLPRQKKFALRREDINECFLEFTIKPGEVVLFSHAILRCHKQELFGSQVPIGNQPWSRIPLDRKIHATEEGHAARRVRPNSSRSCLGFSPNNVRSSSGHKTT